MSLPRLLLLTDRHACRAPLVDVTAACVAAGARAVVLREKDLPAARRRELAMALRPVLAAVGGRLLGASDPMLSPDGVHLAAADPLPGPPRSESPAGPGHVPSARPWRDAWVGRSCHDRTELAAAAAQGCTYATLSPVFPTASKPGYGPPLGTAVLADPPLPTFALGGVDGPAAATACVAAGAHGVAVMGAVMRARDPARVVSDLLAALSSPPTRPATPPTNPPATEPCP